MSDAPKVPKRAKGGQVVAAKMTESERADRGRKGALARWGKPLLAIRKGNFKEEFGVDVDCYVVDDSKRTAMISQTGMAIALGLSPRGNSFPSFITSNAMADSVSGELRAKLEKPVQIQWSSGSGEQPPIIAHGHEAALLIEVCNAISDAGRKGKLGKRYAKVVEQASIINGASAKAGITGLIYALAGYRPEVEEVIQAFKAFVQEEAKKYEKEFPKELYAAWQRLYKIPLPNRGKPWQFMHLTRRHIYFPLAKSNGKILDLLRALRAKDGEQKRYLFQFLNEIGSRALTLQIGRVLEMAETALDDPAIYEKKIVERFGGQHELDLVMPSSAVPEISG